MKAEQKRAVIMGATSGMGREIALILLQKGWKVGVAGRRRELLEEIKAKAPELVVFEVIDVTKKDAPELLEKLIDALGGMDLYLYSSGYGRLNTSLNLDIELDTIDTNVTGFVTTINYAFNFFRQQQYGHIAAISL
ncbi:MAG TPA: SDR family NAD(P)-dependent oxidoreductase, partial [Bacteroidales bacterium]|nr:SDR family NAD(P)-dependent oxidoreductase [Bacteroidales bacterium]